MATPKDAYVKKMRLLSHLRKQDDLRIEEEDAILDELDELWDSCSRKEQKEIESIIKERKE